MDRREMIADAAIEVIADAGLRALTHRRIDESLALPAGSTSYYFRTKGDLLEAVTDRITDQSRTRFHESSGDGPVEVTVAYLVHVLENRAAQVRARHAVLVDPSIDAEARAGVRASLFSVEGAEALLGDRDLAYGYVALCEGLIVTALTVGWTTGTLRTAIVAYLKGAEKL